nr:ribonuclease H-like domain-containing protein [Tanacetum cinerariifolium]
MVETNENTTNPQQVPPTPQASHTLLTIKLPILKKGNGPVQVLTDTNGQIRVLPPKTAEEILARKRERKARTTLLMAIPEDHLEKIHKMIDAKEVREAIKSKFGGNDESKKIQKYLLKQQFESFYVSNLEGLHKGYDKFQSLLSQLKTHGAGVSTEDANQKFLRVFESDVKGYTGSSSSTHNVTFVSSDNTSSINEINTAFDHEDLEQVDEFDLEEMDLKWQKFYKKTGRRLHFDAKEPVGFDKRKLSASSATIHDTLLEKKVLSWTGHAKDDTEDYALMAFNFSNSGSDTEVTSCSKVCEESYAKLKKLYDEQREQLGVAEAEREKEELKTKLENFQSSSKGLSKLLNSQMSAKDKSGLGYGSQIHDRVLNYENEVFASVFDSRSSDVKDSHVNDKFSKVKGIHAVPPHMTGNYMPLKYDFEIDELKFTYVQKQSSTSEFDAKTSDLDSCDSSSSEETLKTVHKPVESKPKVVNEPKVWSDAPIIEEYESDSDDEYDNPYQTLKGKSIVNSGCSRHMNGNKAYLVNYQDFNSGSVAFGGSKGQITGKGKIKTRKLDFEDVYFMKELQYFNLFFVSQMCDKKNKVLFIDTECLVLSPDFKLPDENQVLLRVPRQHSMYSFNLENIVPSGGLTCLIAKATVDESTKWHMRDIIEFCGSKGIKREYSNTKTPQQNEVAERKNMTLIEAARIMLADLFLPNTFWAEVVSTACYVLNRVLSTKPQNKTPYELLTVKIPIISNIRPFGCHVTILNTIDHLGKFEEKSDEGFLVGYSLSSKAFRPITAENKANKTAGPKETNNSAGTQDCFDAGNSKMEADHAQEYYVLPLWSSYTLTVKSSKAKNGDEKLNEDTDSKINEEPDLLLQAGAARASSTNYVNTTRTPVNASSIPPNTASTPTNQDDSQILSLEDIYEVSKDGIFTSASYDNEDYDEVFAPVARIEAIKIFLAFASYMGFIVYQMDVKSFFLYGKIDEEVYVSQPLGFIDPKFPNKVYKVVKALRGLIDKTLFIKKDKKDIMLKFDFLSVKTASTPIETKKPLVKDEKATDVDPTQTVTMLEQILTGNPQQEVVNFLLKVNAARLKLTTAKVYAAEVNDDYALTTSPTIYTSCIKQFWTSTKVKTVNDEVRIQALVDGKRVNIKESSIRRTLRLDDTKGTSCLTNIEIFEGLAKMGFEKSYDKITFYKAFFSPQWKFLIHTILQCLSVKTTSWNEFSSTMASAIICLVTNQKFNFSMFVQLIINHQLGDMAHHKEIFDTSLLTKKVFANMKRVGTRFSREVTTLFDNMLVQAPKEVAKQNLPSPSNDPLPSGKDSLKLKKLMDLCTNLSNKVLELESEVIDIKSTYQERIEKLEGRVERLKEENRVLKELKSVHSTNDDAEPVMEKKKSSKQGRKIADINADVEINLEKAQAEAYNLNLDHQEKVLSMMDVNKEEHVDVEEGLEVVKAAKLTTEVVTTARATKHYNNNQAFLDEVNEGFKVSETEEGTEELKKHLQIVTDDDDVYTDATPLASKIPIVDYKIHTERNRPYFKIIRADGNHMLFISLSIMLKNFDRENLESLWIIVRDRFEKTKPKNYSDDYLLNTLKIMFEKLNVEASVWKDQKGRYGLAKVKGWKLIKSCGVHCITFLST